MPCFWINNDNPLEVSYAPESTEDWTPIQSEYYAPEYLYNPLSCNISYIVKDKYGLGYMLTFSKEHTW